MLLYAVILFVHVLAAMSMVAALSLLILGEVSALAAESPAVHRCTLPCELAR